MARAWALSAAAAVLAAAPVRAGEGAAPARGGRYQALLQPEAQITLFSREAGLVVEIPRHEGAAVQPGEAVVVLDGAERGRDVAGARLVLEEHEGTLRLRRQGTRSEELEKARLRLKEAEARVAMEERSLQAERELYGKGLISEISWQRAERGLESFRASAEILRLDLAVAERGYPPEEIRRAEIEAERARLALAQAEQRASWTRVGGTRPGRAFVSRIASAATVGSWVQEKTALAELVYMDRLRVALDLPPEVGLALAEGTAVVVRAALFPGVDLPGRVTRVAPVVDPGAGSVRVVVEADNPGLRMRPGVPAEVEFAPGGGR